MPQTLGCECGPVCLAEIAARQKLSQSYLEQLFAKLRRAGLVASARGPGGGYRLARGPEAIAIADIIAAVDEPIQATAARMAAPGCIDARDEAPASVRPTTCGRSWAADPVVPARHHTGRCVAGRVRPCMPLEDIAGWRRNSHALSRTPTPASRCARGEGGDAGGDGRDRQSVVVHAAGRAARRMLEDAREALAARFGARRRTWCSPPAAPRPTRWRSTRLAPGGGDHQLRDEHDAVRAAAPGASDPAGRPRRRRGPGRVWALLADGPPAWSA